MGIFARQDMALPGFYGSCVTVQNTSPVHWQLRDLQGFPQACSEAIGLLTRASL